MQRIRNFIKWWNRPNKSVFADYTQAALVIIPIAFLIRTWGYGLYQVPSGSMETTMLVGERFFADKFSYLFSKPKRGDILTMNAPTFNYAQEPVKRWFQMYVWGPENWTKRVIGLPGEHIQGKIEDGKPVVYINGEKLDEPYLNQYPLIHTDPQAQHLQSYDDRYSYEDQPFYRMNGTLVRQVRRLLENLGYPTERKPQTPIDGFMKGSSDEYDVHLGPNQYWVMGDNRLGSYDSRGWGPLDGDLIHGKIVFRILSLDSQRSWLLLDLLDVFIHPIDSWKKFRWSRCMQVMR